MAKKVVWNQRATAQLDEVIDYLLDVASEKIARAFYQEVLDRIDTVSKYPEIGRPSKKKTVRMYPINKRYHLYYRTEGQRLIIVYLFDTKRRPDQNPY